MKVLVSHFGIVPWNVLLSWLSTVGCGKSMPPPQALHVTLCSGHLTCTHTHTDFGPYDLWPKFLCSISFLSPSSYFALLTLSKKEQNVLDKLLMLDLCWGNSGLTFPLILLFHRKVFLWLDSPHWNLHNIDYMNSHQISWVHRNLRNIILLYQSCLWLAVFSTLC